MGRPIEKIVLGEATLRKLLMGEEVEFFNAENNKVAVAILSDIGLGNILEMVHDCIEASFGKASNVNTD